ncbi:MAG: NUDIX domain-containing protein [Proteobacteria bacterium]|nr:NUDIX domain-containing protein [Pseudomonadota bacterium]
MEFIDVLSVEGEKTGRIETREMIHAKGLWHRTVHIWILSKNNDILLQKRAQEKQTHPGLWDMACAGHISSGETRLGAAMKEIHEELGITLSPDELNFLFTDKSEVFHCHGTYIDREFHDIFLVRKSIPLNAFSLQKNEVAALMYLPFGDFLLKVKQKDPSLVPHFEEYSRITDYITSA